MVSFIGFSQTKPQKEDTTTICFPVNVGKQILLDLNDLDKLKKQSILDQKEISLSKVAFIELMEAYAAQAILCARLCDLDLDKVNIRGGALSRGHPIGASGAILAVRLFNELIKYSQSGGKAK